MTASASGMPRNVHSHTPPSSWVPMPAGTTMAAARMGCDSVSMTKASSQDTEPPISAHHDDHLGDAEEPADEVPGAMRARRCRGSPR